MLRSAGIVLASGFVAAAVVHFVDRGEVRLVPGESAWERAVGGATPSGRILDRAVVRLPGWRRTEPTRVMIRVAGARAELRLRLDDGPMHDLRANASGELVLSLPARAAPSATLELLPAAPPLRVTVIQIATPTAWWNRVLAFVSMALLAAALLGRADRADRRNVLAVTLVLGACLALGVATDRYWLPLAIVVVGCALGWRSQFFRTRTALGVALLFGIWVRVFFLPSAGSWDTEYWKAWTARAVDHGTTHVYGDPDAVGDGEFFDQLWGRTELWRTTYLGREFVVDYPPLAMELWRWSWHAVRTFAPGLERGEAENVAVKLPPVVGDVAAVLLLLWLFRRQRERAVTLAALYWALPVSWLSSAVLGFLDGAYAPFAVAALAAAAAGRAGGSGALIAVAALIKPQALIVAPAAAVALAAAGGKLRRAFAAGFAVVVAAVLPFVLAGTLDEAVTHVFRILFQQRLSAGFANSWWLVGHVLSDEPFASKELVPLSGLIANLLFLAAAVFISVRERQAFMAGGGLVFAYAMLALGVHHNHPHVMFLAFLATGMATTRFAWLSAMLASSYVLNMLCLSGIGRFYGPRYMGLEAWSAAASQLRTAAGFDLTELLAVLNIVLFAAFLFRTGRAGRA